MSTTKKVWIGISTFAPLVAIIAIFIFMFMVALTGANSGNEPPVFLLFGGIIGTILCYLVLFATAIINIIVYVSQMVKNDKLDNSSKILWLCLMFFFGFIVMIVYYFMYIVNQKPPQEVTPLIEPS